MLPSSRSFARLRPAAAFALTACLCTPAMPAAAGADEKSAALARRTMEAMGGQEAWDAVRFVRFTFAGARTHHWDKHRGRHRLEGKTREGDAYVVLLDLQSKEGRAWKNGAELTGEEAAEWRERAYGAWINDTYWLIMPFKLFDPGVHLAYEGSETVDGKEHDKVRMTFDQVGLTPGDTYWVYFDRDTGLVARWDYVLEGWEEGRGATSWTWGGWKSYGDVRLASDRRLIGEDRELPLSDIAVFDQLPDAVFESPEPMAGEAQPQ